LQSLIDWSPTSLIFDEAHRLKSSDAKRTDAAIRLSGASDSCLLLSGTPIQNRLSEPATMLHVMNPRAYQVVKKVEKFSIERIKGLLQPSMIRRLKSDVLTQLPPVTEQIVRMPGLRQEIADEIDGGADKILQALLVAGDAARNWKEGMTNVESLRAAWSLGHDQKKLFSIPELGVLGAFEKMRIAAGKVKADHATDIIIDVIENRERVVVFTVHREVSDSIAKTVRHAGYRTEIIDGRKTPEQRQPIVDAFQAGEIDCLIAGMNAAGEGITLHRADTAIFLEMEVKPSTLRQARDRLHRIGQTSQVHAIYLICDHPVDLFFESLCLEKADLTGKVLSETVHILSETRGEIVTKSVESVTKLVEPVLVESVTKLVEPALVESVTKLVEPALVESVTKSVEPAPVLVEPAVTKSAPAVTKSAPAVTKSAPAVTTSVEPVIASGPVPVAARVAKHRAKDPAAYRAYMREYMRKRNAAKRSGGTSGSGGTSDV